MTLVHPVKASWGVWFFSVIIFLSNSYESLWEKKHFFFCSLRLEQEIFLPDHLAEEKWSLSIGLSDSCWLIFFSKEYFWNDSSWDHPELEVVI